MSYQKIEMKLIVASSTNPRTVFDENYIKELSESINKDGLLQAPMVRPKGSKFEIVFGECRWRACKLLNWHLLECQVKEMGDEEAFEAQIIENLQRKDPHPLDEAAAFQKLMQRPGMTTMEVAMKIGKGEHGNDYITRRLKLNDLTDSFKKLFYQGSILLGHAIELCRLQPEDQESLLDEHYNQGQFTETPRALKEEIERNYILNLSKASFSKTLVDLVPGCVSCELCPKRSGFNKSLFNDIEKDDRCADGACFRNKMDAWWRLKETELKLKKIPFIYVSSSWGMNDSDKKKFKSLNVVTTGNYTVVEAKKNCESGTKGLIVHGEPNRVGVLINVCVDSKCPVHRGKKTSASGAGVDQVADLQRQITRCDEISAEKQWDLFRETFNDFIDEDSSNVDLILGCRIPSLPLLQEYLIVDALGWQLENLLDAMKVKVPKTFEDLDGAELYMAISDILSVDQRKYILLASAFEKARQQSSDRTYLFSLVKSCAHDLGLKPNEILKDIADQYSKKRGKLQEKLKEAEAAAKPKKTTPKKKEAVA